MIQIMIKILNIMIINHEYYDHSHNQNIFLLLLNNWIPNCFQAEIAMHVHLETLKKVRIFQVSSFHSCHFRYFLKF